MSPPNPIGLPPVIISEGAFLYNNKSLNIKVMKKETKIDLKKAMLKKT